MVLGLDCPPRRHLSQLHLAVGELLARDRGGDIRAVSGGRILMPLYQDQGNDGFFLARDEEA